MKTVEIVEPFTGYPDGTLASERSFTKGEKPELPDAFAQLLIDKGHAVAPGIRLPVLPPASEPFAQPAPLPQS